MSGREDRRSRTQARRLGSDAVQLEGQIRRHGRSRGQASEAAGSKRLQRPASALGSRLSHAGGLRRQSHGNMRSAAQHGPAPPIARCSTLAGRLKTRRDSNRHWVKVQWQVMCSENNGSSAVFYNSKTKISAWRWSDFALSSSRRRRGYRHCLESTFDLGSEASPIQRHSPPSHEIACKP
jgi:hypothetical protein